MPEIDFPQLGLDRAFGYKSTYPHATPDCLNVRPASAKDQRRRGGSRPGLGLALAQTQSTGAPILGMAQLDYVPDTDGYRQRGIPFKVFSESFDAAALGDEWNNRPYTNPDGSGPLPLRIGFEKMAYAERGENRGNARRIADLDGERRYIIEAFIVPHKGEHDATYSLYAGLDGNSPNALVSGWILDLTLTPGGGYAGAVRRFQNGTNTFSYAIPPGNIGFSAAGWLRLEMDKEDSGLVRGTWYNRTLFTLHQSHGVSTNGPAFGIKCQPRPNAELALIDGVRVQYVPLQSGGETAPRQMLIAVSNGTLYRDRGLLGEMLPVTNPIPIASDRIIDIATHRQAAFIADYGPAKAGGTDGTATSNFLTSPNHPQWNTLGIDVTSDVLEITSPALLAGSYNIAGSAPSDNPPHSRLYVMRSFAPGTHTPVRFRILRGPKVYRPHQVDSQNESISIWSASAGRGSVPAGCHLIARCFGRLFLAGSPAHVWYACRQGDPFDWDYSATDVQRAIASTTAEDDAIGEEITALIPHVDDYMVFGCRQSIWVLRGDPSIGGRMDNITREIGIAIRGGWCRGPSGEIYFLSDDGLYRIAPGANSLPEPLSRDRLPDELRRISESSVICCMAYDVEDRGIAIHLFSASAERVHWWYDIAAGGFWPMTLPAVKCPRVAVRYVGASPMDGGTLYGCQDGWIRKYSRRSSSDEERPIRSYVTIGPLPLGADTEDAIVESLDGKLDLRSGEVVWELFTGHTAQYAVEATVPAATGTWRAGLNYRAWPMRAANSAVLRLKSPEGSKSPWQIEAVSVTARSRGAQRRA